MSLCFSQLSKNILLQNKQFIILVYMLYRAKQLEMLIIQQTIYHQSIIQQGQGIILSKYFFFSAQEQNLITRQLIKIDPKLKQNRQQQQQLKRLRQLQEQYTQKAINEHQRFPLKRLTFIRIILSILIKIYKLQMRLINVLKGVKPISYFSFATIKNPYQILGLKSNATPDQIKKSYRSIAQKYHPDKNPDPSSQKIFVQAKQAYQTLIDQDKRRQYDSQHSPRNSRSSTFDQNPFDQFNDDIFKDKSRTYHDTFTSGSTRRRKGDNIVRELIVQFVEAIKGVNMDIQFERKGSCQSCGGNKCKPGTAPTRCLACGGSGSTIYRKGGIVMHLECQRCKGTGLVIKYPCLDCKATGIVVQRVTQRIVLPPGVQNGQTVTLAQKGDQSQNGPSGDLLLKLIVNKHPKFRKVNDDIQTTEWITISQATLGSNKSIDTIWGKKQIKIMEGSQDGAKIILKNEGVQGLKNKGNHVVVLRIKIPIKLNEKQRKIFQQLAINQQPITEQDTRSKEAEDSQSLFQKMKNAFK